MKVISKSRSLRNVIILFVYLCLIEVMVLCFIIILLKVIIIMAKSFFLFCCFIIRSKVKLWSSKVRTKTTNRVTKVKQWFKLFLWIIVSLFEWRILWIWFPVWIFIGGFSMLVLFEHFQAFSAVIKIHFNIFGFF